MAEPLSGQAWIVGFAAELGLPAPEAATIEALLALAGEAAHDSERIAAPIACWLVGVAGLAPVQALETAKRFVASRAAS